MDPVEFLRGAVDHEFVLTPAAGRTLGSGSAGGRGCSPGGGSRGALACEPSPTRFATTAATFGFEFPTRDRLTDLGLPPDPGQQTVRIGGRTRRIDLGWASRHVGVECVGLAAHSGRRTFDRDARRRNDFAEDGTWTLLELTWTTFHTEWDDFVARLRRLLGR